MTSRDIGQEVERVGQREKRMRCSRPGQGDGGGAIVGVPPGATGILWGDPAAQAVWRSRQPVHTLARQQTDVPPHAMDE